MAHISHLLSNSKSTHITLISRFLDPLSVVSFLVILAKFYSIPFVTNLQVFSITIFLLVIIVFSSIGIYHNNYNQSLKYRITRLLFGWFIVIGLILLTGFVTKTTTFFSKSLIFTWSCGVPFFILLIQVLVRFILHLLVKSQHNNKSAVIVGVNETSLYLAEQIIKYEDLGISLDGYFGNHSSSELTGIPLIGNFSEAPNYVRQHHIDVVYLACSTNDEPQLVELIEALQDTTACVYFVPSLLMYSLMQTRSYELNGVPIITMWEIPFSELQCYLKRSIDVIVSSIALILLSPVMATIAIAVKLSSPGPILFKQRRNGLNGQEIIIYKFRSMNVMENGGLVVQATRKDHRITPVGAFLRKTSLDELPQFLNVLQGCMSLVGPRPHAVAHNEKYRKLINGYMLRHKVKPGITGWAQVHGCRGETENIEKMKRRIQFDLEYLKIWSLELDLLILLKTLFIIFRDQNAY